MKLNTLILAMFAALLIVSGSASANRESVMCEEGDGVCLSASFPVVNQGGRIKCSVGNTVACTALNINVECQSKVDPSSVYHTIFEGDPFTLTATSKASKNDFTTCRIQSSGFVATACTDLSFTCETWGE